MKPAANQPVYTTRSAAKQLGVSLRTVQLWVDNGILKAWKTPGGHRRVTFSSVQNLLQQGGKQVNHGSNMDQEFVVLLIEDDADLLRFYELTIRNWGLPLVLATAGNGYEGLIRAGELQPNLIITDLILPGMDGFDMIHAFYAHPSLTNTGVIAMTSMGQMEIGDRGGLPQGCSVLFKPVSFSELQSLVVNSMKQLTRKRESIHAENR